MAIIGNIAISMTTDASGFKRGTAEASASIGALGAKVNETSSIIRGAFATAVAAVSTGVVAKMVTQASNLTENIGKVGAIFGQQGKGVEADSRAMADTFGVSINSMLDGAGKLGGLFKGAGFSAGATAELSKQFNRLTLDASRFFNVPFDVAFQKIRSGLSGEAEPLRDFGVFLTADKIKAQALSMGIARLGEELTDQAKIAATAVIIQTGLADAQGNAATTAGGAAAKIEEFKGRVDNLVTAMGESLAPVAGAALGGISTAIVAMSNAWEQSKESVFAWLKTTVGSLGLAGESVNVLEVYIGYVGNAWQSVALAFQASQLAINGVFVGLVKGVAYVASAFDSLVESITGGSTGIGETLASFAEGMKDNLIESAKEFRVEWNKPWASNGVSEFFQKARGDMDGLVAKAADFKKITTKLADGVGAKAKKSRDAFAGAALFGSKEAASATLRTKYGAGARDGTAENTKRSAESLARLEFAQRETNKILRERAQGIALEF